MLKAVLTSELKKHFPNMTIQYGSIDNVIATIPPVHQSWKPITIFDDDFEVTVFFGDFTHQHFDYYGEKTDPETEAHSIATDVIEVMRAVFEDRLEFYKGLGGGGSRARGSQRGLSKILFGENGIVWSGN